MRTRKEKMSVFIQVMYGTVIALSFFRLALAIPSDLRLVNSYTELVNFLGSPSFFKVLFLFLTLLLLLQEWVMQEQIKQAKTQSPWLYLPQLLALFCLSQLFVALETLNLKYWYAAAMGYTLSNVAFFYWSNREKNRAINAVHYVRYLLQIFLLEIFFFIIPNDFIWKFYLIAVLLCAYLLLFFSWLSKVLILYFQLQEIPVKQAPENYPVLDHPDHIS
ncbi:hypothetical protein [Pedobacter gandavensis]|uniref:DUF4271 domain-containing protein n=1 Tax=Pedobacter gandavensis TaxID=2679963 RepID=A0ABR6EX01_9SPHI|nr:hypothetical protein [Pedobacter gandavensis]MBB2149339.1 hypothetical protein [Pedobacter gandavensis]